MHFISALLVGILSTSSLISAAPSRSALPRAGSGNQTLESRQANVGFAYGSQKVRGVNLGGWLLLEPFITPWLFDPLDGSIVDEYTFCQNQDRGTAEAALRAHWDTWITEDDFRQIAAAGLNHVRLPFGYWAFVDAPPYISGARDYIYRAINWARQYNIKVILDLHGAVGQQNPFDNSGRRGDAQWGYRQDYIQQTKDLVEAISREFSDSQYNGVVTALAILNEPAGFLSQEYLQNTKDFTLNAAYAARYPYGNADQSSLAIIFHDAFQPLAYWNDILRYPDIALVLSDHHDYQCFSSEENARSWGEHLSVACQGGDNLRSGYHWSIVGEFSLAVYDCARHLNGRGVGSRYDGSYPGSYYIGSCGPWFTGDGNGFSDDYKGFLNDYFRSQVGTYESNGQGWVYWTWKAAPAEWSYQRGLQLGYIPYDLNSVVQNGWKCS